jgi:hypothetical protein
MRVVRVTSRVAVSRTSLFEGECGQGDKRENNGLFLTGIYSFRLNSLKVYPHFHAVLALYHICDMSDSNLAFTVGCPGLRIFVFF